MRVPWNKNNKVQPQTIIPSQNLCVLSGFGCVLSRRGLAVAAAGRRDPEDVPTFEALDCICNTYIYIYICIYVGMYIYIYIYDHDCNVCPRLLNIHLEVNIGRLARLRGGDLRNSENDDTYIYIYIYV